MTARPPTRTERLAGPMLIGMSTMAMLWWTWLTWADDHIDFGRELYLAWRLSLSEVLYRDVAHFQGPLSVYANSLLFRVTGPGILWLALFNIAITAAIQAMLYRLVASFAGRLAATAAGLFFVAVFGFGELVGAGNYNYVCPYAHEMTHGAALSLLLISLLRRYHARGRAWMLAASGAMLGLVFLTKAEIFVGAALAGATYLALILVDHPGGRARAVGTFVASAAVPVGTAIALLSLAMPWNDALRGALGSWPASLNREMSSLYYYRYFMGTEDPARSLRLIALMILWQAAALGPILGAALLRSPGPRRLAGLAAAVVVPALVVALPERRVWYDLGRPWPLYVAAIGLVAAGKWRRGLHRRKDALAVAFAAWAFGLLPKMLLNARQYHYGFVLGMPAVILIVAALVSYLPAFLREKERGGPALVAGTLGLLGAVAVVHLQLTEDKLDRKVLTLGRGADRIRAGPRAVPLSRVLDEIDARTVPRETLLVIPDGVMLNYLSRRRSPTPFVNFMPPELIAFGEDRIVAALAAEPPDLVAVVQNDTYYPYRLSFPAEFGQKLWAFVERGYEDELLVGAPPLEGRDFGILLKRRRAGRPAPVARRAVDPSGVGP